MIKICTKCGESKELTAFPKEKSRKDGRASWCKVCKNAAVRAYRATAKGRARAHAAVRAYHATDRGKACRRAAQRTYRMTDKGRARHTRQERKRRKDPVRRLRNSVSTAVYNALKATGGSKAGGKTFSQLPYSLQQLKDHLEELFASWMNWSNYGRGEGKWTLDHIIPQSAFHYTSMNDPAFKACWAISNLRPLGCMENVLKSNRLELLAASKETR